MKDNKNETYMEMHKVKQERAAQARCIIETMDEKDVEILFCALMDALIDKESEIAFNLSQNFLTFNKVLDGVICDMRG